jgi:hypothetical protein
MYVSSKFYQLITEYYWTEGYQNNVKKNKPVHRLVLSIDFTPPGSTINAAAYQETLKRLEEDIQRKRPNESFCMTMLDLTVLPQPCIS